MPKDFEFILEDPTDLSPKDEQPCCEECRILLYARGLEAQLARDKLKIDALQADQATSHNKMDDLLQRLELYEARLKSTAAIAQRLDESCKAFFAAEGLIGLGEAQENRWLTLGELLEQNTETDHLEDGKDLTLNIVKLTDAELEQYGFKESDERESLYWANWEPDCPEELPELTDGQSDFEDLFDFSMDQGQTECKRTD